MGVDRVGVVVADATSGRSQPRVSPLHPPPLMKWNVHEYLSQAFSFWENRAVSFFGETDRLAMTPRNRERDILTTLSSGIMNRDKSTHAQGYSRRASS